VHPWRITSLSDSLQFKWTNESYGEEGQSQSLLTQASANSFSSSIGGRLALSSIICMEKSVNIDDIE